MVQFLPIHFFLGFLQFLLGFSKVPFFLCHSVFRGQKQIRHKIFGSTAQDLSHLPDHAPGICAPLVHCHSRTEILDMSTVSRVMDLPQSSAEAGTRDQPARRTHQKGLVSVHLEDNLASETLSVS